VVENGRISVLCLRLDLSEKCLRSADSEWPAYCDPIILAYLKKLLRLVESFDTLEIDFNKAVNETKK
jgi:hypothetical protein